MRKLDAHQLAREKSLFRYSSALERADFNTVAAILQEAERDPLLARMIAEINTVYESETFGLSPSLNHSSNHKKDYIMTTIVLPNRKKSTQWWLPITLAAACVSVLFIGTLMLRPIRPNTFQAGIQVQASATPSPAASPTIIPSAVPTSTPFPASVIEPTLIPPDVQLSAINVPISICNGAITSDGTTMHITNQLDTAATIFAAPLTSNSNAVAVGQFPAKGEATLLYQQYDQASAPLGALWYLIMTNDEGEKQVTGWVSANSVTAENGCASSAGGSGAAPVTITQGTLNEINSVAVESSVQAGTCHVINVTGSAVPLFAAPLTLDSNAAVVGEFAVNRDATIILQNNDLQSAGSVGALWYLITINGEADQKVTGWVSANSLGSPDSCRAATAVEANVTGAAVPSSQTSSASGSAGGTNIVAVPDTIIGAESSAGICHVINRQSDSIPVYSAPSNDGSESVLVNNLIHNALTTVLYQQRNKRTGQRWYLVLAVMEQDKQISGWVSADSVTAIDNCPALP